MTISQVNILAEQPDFIVVNKPAGLIVHHAVETPRTSVSSVEPRGVSTAADTPLITLVDILLKQYPELMNVGEDSLRPGIVHRLDKDVSGVMVIARTPTMLAYLKQQFQEHLIYKQYLAIVHGLFSKPEGVINFAIQRSAQDSAKMAARPVNAAGRPAQTDYTVVQQYQRYALVSLIIHTGRTHQIRVHLNAIGHPIIGDEIYRPKKFKTRLNPGRIFLHAETLSFKQLNGETVQYTASLPKIMQDFLKQIAKTVR